MSNINFEIYKQQKPTKECFDNHAIPFIESDAIEPGVSILDIGGACGHYLEMINRTVNPINATVVDIDQDCLDYGKSIYPHIHFVNAEFPNIELIDNEKFDIVLMQALFPHLKDWKSTVKNMVRLANKYINFSAIIKKDGPTIADDEISYFYYFNTGKRCAQVILNLYDFLNFLCLEEIRAKTIFFHGSYCVDINHVINELKNNEITDDTFIPIKKGNHGFRPPFYDDILGNFTIELFSEEDNPRRMGGVGLFKQEYFKFEDYKFFMPRIYVMINHKMYYVFEDGINYYNAHDIQAKLNR